MVKIEEVKQILNKKNASLVVGYENGIIKEYYNDRIIDLVSILKENENALKNSVIADKVIGKVAASIMAVSGVKEIYANTLSKYAVPVLEKANIKYYYKELTEYIKNKDKTGMCPMEAKYKDETDITKIYKNCIKQ